MSQQKAPNKELEIWKDAVWDYLLEHCDVMEGGKIFVKFHSDSRYKFECRIRSRIQGYHRGDPRATEKKVADLALRHQIIKEYKEEQHKKEKAKRIRIYKVLKFLKIKK